MNVSLNWLKQYLDISGYTPEELKEAQVYEQKESITPKKIWDLLEYLIKLSSGH